MNKIKNKIVLLGDVFVGKTSIATRFSKDEFKDNNESTTSGVFFTHTIEKDGKKLQFDIWDTAGQERFKALGEINRRSILQKFKSSVNCFRYYQSEFVSKSNRMDGRTHEKCGSKHCHWLGWK